MLDREAARVLWHEPLDDRHRARITTWIVDQRKIGMDRPRVTNSVIEEARTARGLTADERAERLLGFLAQQTGNLGAAVSIAQVEQPIEGWVTEIHLDVARWAKAISESVDTDELFYLLDYLESVGWISTKYHNDSAPDCTVTVAGYRQIAEQEVNPSSDQVFVAMWFDPSMEEARDYGIRPAILNTGYRPQLIDEKPDVDKIDDEIIGEIRRSRFLIADFTYGDKGMRGGVYYEAGFALGLGLEVIRSCRADQIDDLHFDVNHHYHIAWKHPRRTAGRLGKADSGTGWRRPKPREHPAS